MTYKTSKIDTTIAWNNKNYRYIGDISTMSQVKLPTPNPSGSIAVDLIDGPAADLL